MFGQTFDTSLAQAFYLLLFLLAKLIKNATFAGVLTLPLFYLDLVILNGWFWALDEAKSGDDESKKKRSPFRRIGAPLLVWLIPLISFAATAFVCTYFFGGSGTSGDSSNPKVAPWGKIQFDEVTRAIAKKATKTEGISKSSASDGTDPEEEAIKDPLMIIRAVGLIGLLLIGPFPTLIILLCQLVGRIGLILIIRSLSRNLLRTSLTYLATYVLVFVVVSIWAILGFLDQVTQEKESNLKAIVTEKNQIPSQMKPSHEDELKALIAELPDEYKPKNGDDDLMTWAFVGGSLDPQNRTPQNSLFLFCMEPKKLLTMMDGLEDLTGEQRALLKKAMEMMEENRTLIVLGKERLAQIGKRVGDEFQLTSFNYTDIVFKFKIIGVFPEGRYDQSAIMNRDYLKRALEEYKGYHNGKEHPLADKSLNLIWVRMPNKQAFEVLAEKVNSSGKFNPAVKMETASSAIGSFLDPFKDLIWGMRHLLAPALLITMSLVISNAISISVRERRTEMAVLKVLGFRPWMVMALILGEAVLIGALSGFMATATAFAAINALGGIPLPIAFFPKFTIPPAALWWGPAIGAATALLGSILPAWTASKVKASEVFSKVA